MQMGDKKRVAIIDLGTNTFHLLISEIDNGNTLIVYKKKQYVKLASNGIFNINDNAFSRGLETMQNFKQAIDSYGVSQTYAFGTAALRTASNSADFIEKVYEATGITISVIQGEKEADYIWKGARQAVGFGEEKVLIMDIGGGSVEFVIANQQAVFWKKSFPIGASVLKNVYHKVDPISLESRILLNQYLDDVLKPMVEVANDYDLKTLVGASGTFDTLVALKKASDNASNGNVKTANLICKNWFTKFTEDLLESTQRKRLQMPGMEAQRAEMMVVATIMVDFVVKKLELENIVQSTYALKQGALWSLIYEN